MGDYATLVTTEGVMVISVAYRLGIYGFLYNTDGEDGEGSDT
jgi:carboxylesterase type B